MMIKKLAALLLAALMLMSTMTACGNLPLELPFGDSAPTVAVDVTEEGTYEPTEAPETEPSTAAPTESVEIPTPSVKHDTMPEALKLEKVTSVTAERVGIYEGGIIYTDANNKMGIVSLDGKNDTGAKYGYCRENEMYFVVANALPDEAAKISDLNCAGLVDGNGKELIPMQYASVEVLNERFAKACEVTAQAESQEGALVYYSDKQFSFLPDEDDTFFKGNWYIYDLTTGQKVPGASGTQPYICSAKGNYVRYTDDAKESHTVDAQGNAIVERATLFDSGAYKVYEGDEGAVYDKNGKKLFTFDPDGYVPNGEMGEYLYACCYEKEDDEYVMMDYQGNIVSAGFPELPYLYGRLIECEDKLYDFQGNQVYDGTYEYVTYDERLENVWLLSNYDDDNVVVIYGDGTVLCSYVDDDSIYSDSYSFVVAEKDGDGKKTFFCVKDGDYTLEADYALSPWLITKSNADWTEDLIDTISGKTLLSGYADFGYGTYCESGYYISAETEDGVHEIYMVKS